MNQSSTAVREATGSRPDLRGAEDVRALVDAFYAKVQVDELLSPIFNDVAKIDWAHHLSVMYKFWELLLFRTGGYDGSPFPKHAVLPIGTRHFQRWLSHFIATVDERHAGPKAEEAKTRAKMIGNVFQVRMGLIGAGDPFPL